MSAPLIAVARQPRTIRVTQPRTLLRALFHAAIEAASPALCLPPFLPRVPAGRTVVVGAGKAACSMAIAVEAHWPASAPLEGLVVTRYGHGVAGLRRIGAIEAAHPVPDDSGASAAARILAMVGGLGAGDLVLALVSGGGSALLALPLPGITLADKQDLARALLRSGASIGEMNCVRRHLSAIKGGRLAKAAAPASVVSLVISDVPGDDPAVVASGPTVADATTQLDARAVLARWRIAVPDAVARVLADAALESPKPDDAAFLGNSVHVIASARASLEAAASVARAAGLRPIILGDAIEGDAAEVARGMAQVSRRTQPGSVLLSGGETTVRVQGQGRGGRNAHFLLALAVALNGQPGVHALAADTDGIDGTQDNAGAFLSPDTLAKGRLAGLDAAAMLAGTDAYTYFGALGDLLVTGPTLTNVNDFRAILVV